MIEEFDIIKTCQCLDKNNFVILFRPNINYSPQTNQGTFKTYILDNGELKQFSYIPITFDQIQILMIEIELVNIFESKNIGLKILKGMFSTLSQYNFKKNTCH
jgi:hypothetical protein